MQSGPCFVDHPVCIRTQKNARKYAKFDINYTNEAYMITEIIPHITSRSCSLAKLCFIAVPTQLYCWASALVISFDITTQTAPVMFVPPNIEKYEVWHANQNTKLFESHVHIYTFTVHLKVQQKEPNTNINKVGQKSFFKVCFIVSVLFSCTGDIK